MILLGDAEVGEDVRDSLEDGLEYDSFSVGLLAVGLLTTGDSSLCVSAVFMVGDSDGDDARSNGGRDG